MSQADEVDLPVTVIERKRTLETPELLSVTRSGDIQASKEQVCTVLVSGSVLRLPS